MTDPTLDWLRSEMEDARERCEAATEGPWTYDLFTDVRWHIQPPGADDGESLALTRRANHPTNNTQADATFIAHARRDLPAALSVLDRIGTDLADADMDTLFDALDRLEDACGPEVVEVLGELRDAALRREQGREGAS